MAGCQAAQKLGFGQCINPEENCQVFDLRLNDCITCQFGFDKDYRGKCVAPVTCGPRQYPNNGNCINYPSNCAQVDDDGDCTLCLDPSQYTIIGGFCILNQNCPSGSYRNDNDECVLVSPDCATFNPSTGGCITCRIPNTFPSNGVCCPPGSVYFISGCVSSSTLTNQRLNPQGNGCLQVHPNQRRCIKCPSGYKPDPILPLNCIPIYP